MSLRNLLTIRCLALPVAAAVLTLATPAFADSLTFGSYAGTAPAGLSNGTITYDNTGAGAPSTTLKTGTVTAFPGAYGNNLAGTSWVSYDPNTFVNGDNGGVTVYTTSFVGNSANDSGSISLLADDTVSVYLNGTFLGNTAPSAFDTLKTFAINTGTYKNGLNTFTFNVVNANGTTTNGGPTAFDFSATAVSPEPSSLILLSTGALSLAGAIRRKIAA